MGFYITDEPRNRGPRAAAPPWGPKPARGPIREVISGYRFYNPDLGRWINRDPLGEAGGESLYACMNNNSVGQYDYLGMLPFLGKLALDCFKSFVFDMLLEFAGKKWDDACACNELNAKAFDPDFRESICEGVAFDAEMSETYQGKTVGQLMLGCISKGLVGKKLDDVLKKVTDPVERKLIKKILQKGADDTIDGLVSGVKSDASTRIYAWCEDGAVKTIRSFVTKISYQGASYQDTDISDPYLCEGTGSRMMHRNLHLACRCCED